MPERPGGADLPAGISSADLYDLARIGWDRGNEVSETPAGCGYHWDEIDADTRAGAMEEIRAVLMELERCGLLSKAVTDA